MPDPAQQPQGPPTGDSPCGRPFASSEAEGAAPPTRPGGNPPPTARPSSESTDAERLAALEARNAAVNVAHGAVQAVAINLYNPFLGINLVRLGANNVEVAMLSSLPPLASTLTSIAGARWLARQPDPKRAGAAMFALARLTVLGLAAVDLLAARSHRPWLTVAFVAFIGLLNVPVAVGNLCWQALITGLLRPAARGRALARRIALANLVGVTVALLAGWWARHQPGLRGYIWLYGLAAGVGLVEASVFLQLRGDVPIQRLPPDLVGAARRLWAARPYRNFILACLPFYLGWLMAWPLFLRYQVSYAGATTFWMGAYTAVNALCGAVGNTLWQRVQRRIGAALALPLSIVALSSVPASYLFHPGLGGLMLPQVLGGLAGGGVNLLLLLRLMEVAPEEDRALAMGLNNTFIGAVGVLGPLVGVALLPLLSMRHVFWVPTALRLCGGLLLLAAARPRTAGWGRSRLRAPAA